MQSHRLRLLKLSATLAFVTLTTAYAIPNAPTAKTKNPLEATEVNVALGLDHYDAHCATCHGKDGKADTEKGRAVRAADLTSEKMQSKTDAELFRTISRGVAGTAMPGFAKTHKPTEIWQTILFLRKLPKLTPEERAKLEAAVPAGARHKHAPGQEHKHPEAPQTQPEGEPQHQHPTQEPAKPQATKQAPQTEHQH